MSNDWSSMILFVVSIKYKPKWKLMFIGIYNCFQDKTMEDEIQMQATKRQTSDSSTDRPVRSGWHLCSTSQIDTSTTFSPLITLTLRVISVRCSPLSLRSTTESNTSASYLDLLLSIGKDGQIRISISILQTFRPWGHCVPRAPLREV